MDSDRRVLASSSATSLSGSMQTCWTSAAPLIDGAARHQAPTRLLESFHATL